MVSSQRYRERLQKLFADFDLVVANPVSNLKAVRSQIEDLRTRLHQLEADISVLESQPTSQDGAPSSIAHEELFSEKANLRALPILYEKEFLGYAYTGEQIQPLTEPPSNKKTNCTAPLIIRGEPVGKMQVAPPSENNWTPEQIHLLDVVAQRASQQIENLRLLSEAERARVEAESATRRYMHDSWDSYMDAIHQSERVGFAYDQTSVTPFLDETSADGGVTETVKVMEEQVGTLFVRSDPVHPLTEQDRDMVAAIASQIAQQVENIRLLADAARARAEAEEATRRLTYENWQSYVAQKEENPGFVYDSNQVLPVKEASQLQDLNLVQPLTVRGETIGRLGVAGLTNIAPEANNLLAAIAAQTSIHLETLRLTEELQKRAEELQELDRLKSTFLANMSHELRTPLNSILGFADVMLEELDGPLTENMNNDLRLVQKNGQHLLHLINDVLDMAKIEAGRMNLSPEKFRIHEIFEEVVSITSPLASEKDLSLFIEANSDQDVEVFADRTRMRQVMINLVNNAMKFTEKGKITLYAMRRADQVLIKVQDTGIGIPPDKLEIIFQEFAQVDSSATRKAGGTGLGLPISRRLVELHGGRLWAESAGISGEGSTFYVELPLEARIAESVEKVKR